MNEIQTFVTCMKHFACLKVLWKRTDIHLTMIDAAMALQTVIDQRCIVHLQSQINYNFPSGTRRRKRILGAKEERVSYSRQDWVKPGWRCASSSPPPLSLPETRWSLGSLPPIRPTGETEQKHLRSSPSDMGSSLHGLSKADRDGAITKDEGRQVQREVGLNTSLCLQQLHAFVTIIFLCCWKSHRKKEDFLQ